MKRLNLIQGTPEWRAARGQFPCASEAPVMMGASGHMTRAELLRLKAAGMEREFSDFVQRMVLDKGHQVEGPARAITEQQIGERLYPVTATDDAGEYLASLDGITMAEDWLMEHKQWNEELAAAIRAGATEFPDGQEWQLEQQLLVADEAEGVIFVCSDGTTERRVQMEYRRVPGRAQALRAGWKQFHHDLEHGDHTPAPAKVVAAPVDALPMVQVTMGGSLTVKSNLDAFGNALMAFIERIPAKPSTDQEFADTDAACKALKRAEESLESEEARALASMADVEQMRALVGKLRKLARDTRLQREKLVEARKLEIRTEEIARGKQALAEFIAGLNVTIGKTYMPAIPHDFATAIKGKKTVQGARDAIDQHLADCKLLANDIAGKIVVNMRALRELAADHAFLFADTPTLVLKAPDDCRATITSRIGEHRQAEERRAAELAERERARIRAEEEARARATAARQQQEREALERRQREEQEAQACRELQAKELATRSEPEERMLPAAAAPAPAANAHPMPTRAPAAPSTPPSLRLGQINERIGCGKWSEDDMASLGFLAAGRDRAAVLYHEHDFARIVAALIAHLQAVQMKQAA